MMKETRLNVLFGSCVGLLLVLLHTTSLSAQAPTIPYLGYGKIHPELTATENSIIFVGDVLLARSVEKKLEKYGSSYPYRAIAPLMRESIVVGNFEAAVPSVHVPTPDFKTTFSVNQSHIPSFIEAGFTHLSLANNHSLDFGGKGFENTKKVLEQAGAVTFGDQRRVSNDSISYVGVGDSTIALIGINAVFSTSSPSVYRPTVERATENSDYQIVYIHWGEEYELTANKTQQKIAYQLVDAGADLIVGHHPHVVQNVEVYKESLIFYSLGNFIFDQYFSRDVQESLVLKLTFDEQNEPSVALVPVDSVGTPGQPHLMNTKDAASFLANLAKRSTGVLTQMIPQGQISLKNLQFHHDSNTMSRLID